MSSQAPIPTSSQPSTGEYHLQQPPASPAAANRLAPQPKQISELRPSLSGRAYYIDARSGPYDAHLARPQSALIRGSKAGPITSSTYVIHDKEARRPSLAHSLPVFKPSSSSTSPVPRQIQSENASLSGYQHHFPEKDHSDTILGHPTSKDYENEDLDEATYQNQRIWSVKRSSKPTSGSPPSHVFSTYSVSNGGQDDGDNDSTPTARQTLRSLVHLSLGAPPLSLAIFFYAAVVLLYSILTAPFRLCFKPGRSLSSQLTFALIGPLNLQRRCIYVVPIQPTSSRNSSSSRTPLSSDDAVESQNLNLEYSSVHLGKLVSIHLLAPLLAIPMALSAWVMAVAWGLGVIVSDERAGDDRDERRLAQNLVNYWGSWLDWGIQYKPRSSSPAGRRGRKRMRPEMTMASSQ